MVAEGAVELLVELAEDVEGVVVVDLPLQDSADALVLLDALGPLVRF